MMGAIHGRNSHRTLYDNQQAGMYWIILSQHIDSTDTTTSYATVLQTPGYMRSDTKVMEPVI
jgi:hypothetical protein